MARTFKARRGYLELGTALFAIAWLAAPAQAEEKPLWEFGVGLGALGFEDYRGSDSTHVYPVPIVVGSYNGPFLKADREGVRGELLKEDWIEVNLSANATTPVRNDAERYGMPELRPTVELGPAVNLHLYRNDDGHIKLDFRMPLRAAVTVQAAPQYIGWTLTPSIALDILDPFGYGGWHLGLLSGPLFADRKYDNYFYSVAPQFATLARPAYQAPGGYAGTQFITALSKRFPKYWVGAYVRYDTLAGASFEDSPLVRRDYYWSAGIGFAWMIGKSTRMVNVPD
jgi:outer membrane protein